MIVLAATLIGMAYAACPNACSGHGLCHNSMDYCECYRDWTGADCSQRVCPYDIAIVDGAQGDLNMDGHMHMIFQDPATANSKDVPITSRGHTVQEWEYHPVHAYGRKDQVDGRGIAAEEGHFYMECSNKGTCDRKTGLCECFDGFEGRACHRMVCPGGFDCNGHGTCQYIKNMRTHNGERQDGTAWGYDLWDVNTARACVCDKGWAGVDCNRRLCPRGDDPLSTSDDTSTHEVQKVQIDCASSENVGGSLKLEYTDTYGFQWRTKNITAASGSAAGSVESELEALPNSVIEGITTSTDSGHAADSVQVLITFTHNPGNVNQVGVDERGLTCSGSATPSVTVSTVSAGGNTNTECSNRGLCDYDTGLCECFPGYTGDDCSDQNALAV